MFSDGYPGSYSLTGHEPSWSGYIRDSLVETVLARDVLQLQTVAKSALLRHLFLLSDLEKFRGGRARKRGSSPKLIL